MARHLGFSNQPGHHEGVAVVAVAKTRWRNDGQADTQINIAAPRVRGDGHAEADT
jgi:hypothetical protein